MWFSDADTLQTQDLNIFEKYGFYMGGLVLRKFSRYTNFLCILHGFGSYTDFNNLMQCHFMIHISSGVI